jgi:hypothetical protein
MEVIAGLLKSPAECGTLSPAALVSRAFLLSAPVIGEPRKIRTGITESKSASVNNFLEADRFRLTLTPSSDRFDICLCEAWVFEN